MGCFKQTALVRSKPLGLQTFSSKNKLCRKLQPTYNLLDWMKEVLSHNEVAFRESAEEMAAIVATLYGDLQRLKTFRETYENRVPSPF